MKNRHRFNWKMIDSFKYKFKRSPKLRTIQEVHSLYIRAIERSSRKSSELLDCMNEIVENIEPVSGKYTTYFYNDNILYEYSMSYNSSYESFGVSCDRVRFDIGSIGNMREKKINFVLNSIVSIKLGEKYRRLSNSNRYYHNVVRCAFEDMLITILDERFKDVKSSKMSSIIPIIIDNRRYIFRIDDSSSYGLYKKFIFLGESKDDIIL